MIAQWRERGYGTCYGTANEPGCSSNWDLWNLCEYSIGAMQEADRLGVKLSVLNLPEGNPCGNPGDTEEQAIATARWKIQQLFPAAQYAAEHGHYVVLHCYWRPGVCGPLDRWHGLGNALFIVETWAEMGLNVGKLQLLIGETGIDGGIAGHEGRKGWRSLSDWATYLNEIAQLEHELQRHDFIKGAFLFVSGYEPPWEDYDLAEGEVRALGDRLGEPPSTGDPILDEAAKHVIEMVPGYSLFDYIMNQGWIPCSHEFSYEDWTYQWGYDSLADDRVLCRAKAPYWHNVEEYTRVAN